MKKIVFLFVYSFCISLVCNATRFPGSAKYWNAMGNHQFSLVCWGKYENGKEMTKYFPSQNNGNKNEYWRTVDGNTLLWMNTQVGDQAYKYYIDGQYMRLSNRMVNGKLDTNFSGWFKLEWVEWDGENDMIILVIDAAGYYRYLKVE